MKNALSLIAAAALSLAASHALAQPVDDHSFIQKAVAIDTAEIQMGDLFQKQGASSAVRSYGAMLVHDHTDGRRKAEAAAHRMGVDAPEQADPQVAAQLTQLQTLAGAAFDRQARKIAIDDHRQAIGLFQQEATNGHGPAAAHANATLPVLRKHLRMAEALPA